MFKRLRNKLILINLGITSFVIVVIFSTIYMISTRAAENRPMKIQDTARDFVDVDEDGIPDDYEDFINFSMRQEKKSAAENLLVTLICSGIAIEIVVVIVSWFMAEEAIKPVKNAYEAQKVFVANASHEIKTPLAAISANLEAADIKNNKWIENVEKETAKLTTLNNGLLCLAKTDLVTEVKLEEVELGELTNTILKDFEPRLNGKKLTRQINIGKKVQINRTDYEQLLGILMDNAIKYSNKSITVKLSEHSLSVSNDGKKIPNDKIAYIFDRFYQADKSSDGVGLGLSIAKSLAERNHWQLHVHSVKQTVFTLSF